MNPSLGNRFSQHSFAQVPSANTPRSKFDRSFATKDTMNFDELVPIYLEEILPGDTINLNVKTFMRLATQAVPMMDNMYVDFYFFFVPNRLVWNNFQKQMGEQENPGDTIDYLTPIMNMTASSINVGSLADHYGLPTATAGTSTNLQFNSLPFRGYNLIRNQWFRDQNLQTSLPVPKTDGPDAYTDFGDLANPIKIAKKHDYFTSALPFAQKGQPVNIPLAGTAQVYGNGSPITWVPGNPNPDGTGGRVIQFADGYTGGPGGAGKAITYAGGNSNNPDAYFAIRGTSVSQPSLEVDFDFASDVAITINSFRQAMQMQTFLERDARGGTRYTEILKSHFNVISPDARLQRTEFLSAATINISQHPVAQTSESATTPQANLAAFSTAAEFGNKIGFSKSFLEHGFVHGFARARADVTYQQGLDRFWSRRTRYDYFWPEFQELGEQAILSKEIYWDNASSDNNNVFGYQERYAEYRYRPSQIKGQFRSTYAESLDVWHLSEEFGSRPLLNNTFIQGNTPIERALVVAEGYPALLCDFWFDLKHVRPMVAYPVPAGLGRF